MKKLALLAATALLAACGARTELRYEPVGAPPAAAAWEAVSGVSVADASGGLRSEGAGLTLTRPFFDTFKDAVSSQLAALRVAPKAGADASLDFQLTAATLERGSGLGAKLTSTVKYQLIVKRGGREACRQDVVGWAQMSEGFASSPTAETLKRALAKSMENLGPALDASCLAAPGAGAKTAAAASSAPRDPKTWAILVGVGRDAPSAAADARAAAEYARTTLGVPDDHVLVLVDEMATLASLRKHFGRWLTDRLGPDGKVFIALFGRGAPQPAAFFLPFDGDPQFMDETALPLARLYADLGKLPGRAEIVLGAGVGAPRPGKLPNGVRVFSADADPRGAFQAMGSDWSSR